MSTRAVYTFIDNYSEYHVYKHLDNYPSGGCKFINKAITLAWPLPRFEADEFAVHSLRLTKQTQGICISQITIKFIQT